MLERFMGKDGIASVLRIFIEQLHLVCRISLCQNGNIDALAGRPALQQITVRSDPRRSTLMNQDILGIDFMLQYGTRFPVCILQTYGHHRRLLGIRQEEGIFETPCQMPGFLFAQPFLKEAGKRSAVNNLAARLIGHGNIAIAFQRKLAERMTPPRPAGKRNQFI